MKKMSWTLMACLLMVTTWLSGAGGATAAELPLRIELQGNRIYFPDEQPYVDKAQRVMVPVRFVSEAMAADVDWTSATKTVTIELNSNVITLVLGQKQYDVNGQKLQMDTEAKRVGGRTFVPLRFVSEGLGAYVKWDSKVRTVYISMTPFESGDTAENEDPEQDEKQVVEENMHGFKVKLNTGSGLEVEKGTGTGRDALINFLILFPEMGDGIDYEAQFKEVEEVLSQRVKADTVKAVFQYARKKTNWRQGLEQKTFSDGTYKIYVGSSINEPIDITIFPEK